MTPKPSSTRAAVLTSKTYKPIVLSCYNAACGSYYKKQAKSGNGSIESWLNDYGDTVFGRNLMAPTQCLIRLRNRFSRNGSSAPFWISLEDGEWYKKLCEDVGCESIETMDGQEISGMKREQLAQHPEFFCHFRINNGENGEPSSSSSGSDNKNTNFCCCTKRQVVPMAKYGENTDNEIILLHKMLTKALVLEVANYLCEVTKRKDIKETFSIERTNNWVERCIQNVVNRHMGNGSERTMLVGKMMKEYKLPESSTEGKSASSVGVVGVESYIASRLKEDFKESIVLAVQDLQNGYSDIVSKQKKERIASELFLGEKMKQKKRNKQQKEGSGSSYNNIYPSVNGGDDDDGEHDQYHPCTESEDEETEMTHRPKTEEEEKMERMKFVSNGISNILRDALIQNCDQYGRAYMFFFKMDPTPDSLKEKKRKTIIMKNPKSNGNGIIKKGKKKEYLGGYNGTVTNPESGNSLSNEANSTNISARGVGHRGGNVSMESKAKLERFKMRQAREQEAERVYKEASKHRTNFKSLYDKLEKVEKSPDNREFVAVLTKGGAASGVGLLIEVQQSGNRTSLERLGVYPETGGAQYQQQQQVTLQSMSPSMKYQIDPNTMEMALITTTKPDEFTTKKMGTAHFYRPNEFKKVTFLIEN